MYRYNQQTKETTPREKIICGLLIGAIASVVIAFQDDGLEYGYRYSYSYSPRFGILFLILAGILFFASIIVVLFPKLEKHREYVRIRKSQKMFAKLFYETCQKEKVTCVRIDNDYEKKKVKLIAEKLITTYRVPTSIAKNYLENLSQIYEEGQLEYIEEINTKERLIQESEQKAEEIKKQVATATCDENITEIIRINKSTVDKVGLKKRRTLLLNLKREYEKQIIKEAEHKKAVSKTINNLPYMMQEKTVDWAVLGGAASAIAGPAAGVVVAADAMRRNAEIEARNAERRVDMLRAMDALYSATGNIQSSMSELKAKTEMIDKEIESLDTKVVLNDGTDTNLFDYLEINNLKVTRQKTDVLKITVDVKSTYQSDVPEGVEAVMDGTLLCKITAKELGTVTDEDAVFALPLYGVKCGETINLEAYSCNYIPAEKEYIAEIRPNTLSIVEL